MAKRAERLAHYYRLKKNRSRFWWGRRLDDAEAARAVDTPTPCSCRLCGNPRRYWREEHVSELRNRARAQSEIEFLAET